MSYASHVHVADEIEQGGLADAAVANDRAGLELVVAEPAEDLICFALTPEEPRWLGDRIAVRERILRHLQCAKVYTTS